jgi:hypothetical protein
MTIWDILDKTITILPPAAATFLFVALVVVFLIGFSKHGLNFFKYGFKQIALDTSFDKRFDQLESNFEKRFEAIEAKFETKFDAIDARFEQLELKFETRFEKLESKIEAIEVNHFGHLKNYLGILNGILLDKDIIDNETKARLDNEVRGM